LAGSVSGKRKGEKGKGGSKGKGRKIIAEGEEIRAVKNKKR
jgi:hypothetical protein